MTHAGPSRAESGKHAGTVTDATDGGPLTAIFAAAPTALRKQPDQCAVLQQRLRAAEAQAERLRGRSPHSNPTTASMRHGIGVPRNGDRTLSTGPNVAIQPGLQATHRSGEGGERADR